MRTTEFASGEYYHIYNRGVDKRQIFLSPLDFERFYESLYLFNDRSYDRKGGDKVERTLQLAGAEVFGIDRDPLASILSFELMSNHFHMLIRQERDGGVSEFMHRVGTGYTNYFNGLYKRTGSLFEGPFHAVQIQSDAQLIHVIRYIHLNGLDGSSHLWREGEVLDWDRALHLLDQYSWSSHHFYMGRDQELPVLNEQLVHSLFPDPGEYSTFLRGWSQREIAHLSPGILWS
ncbi:transposase [Candidatus Uhrbacteria bacterium]|nr:transposase [Candidatus Uhrbacteria bacterium]